MKTIPFFHQILAALTRLLRLAASPAGGGARAKTRSHGNYRWLILLMTLCCLAQTLQAEFFEVFQYTDNGTEITIDNYLGSGDEAGAVVIPNSIIGKPVTHIGDFSFMGHQELTGVTIPDGVISIGISAFYGCNSLLSITMPPSVTSIGGAAFYGCSSLTTIAIPAGLTSIEGGCFQGCSSISSILIPKNVTAIGDAAFAYCGKLKSVMVGSGVTSISSSAFFYCTSLTNINIDPLSSIYSSSTGVLFNKNQTRLIMFPEGKSGHYSIFSGVSSIGDGAFARCSKLTSVTIPQTLTNIGSAAFYQCTSLASITIPDSVSGIGDETFYGCSRLSRATVPGSVAGIGRHAFMNCANLTDIAMGDGVTSIGESAFEGCGSLTSITIPDSVTRIGEGAFSHCFLLSSAKIGDGVTSIGSLAFYVCSSLTRITIPSRVSSIEDHAFFSCGSLTKAIFTGNAPLAGEEIFGASDVTVYYSNARTGFTSPTWFGYASVTLSASREISITDPTGAELKDGGIGIDFGTVNVGANEVKTFTIANVGITELGGLTIINVGKNASDFTVKSLTASDLPPAGKITFTVAFTPRTNSLRKAAIHITSNDSDESPFDITLRGTGINSPEIAVQQPAGKNLADGVSSKSFGSVAVKTTVTKTFTIRNAGTANLKNLAITKTGTNANNFTIKAPLKTTLVPGESTTFKVVFKPSAKGVRKAVIHIRSNDRNENPFDIALTGKGVASHPVARLAESTISAPGLPSRSNGRIRSAVSTMQIQGKKYRCITIFRSGTSDLDLESVEVSPNLMDWFSGTKHATVIEDRAELLMVRDNTPIEPGKKRFIRASRLQDMGK